jgi:hypothetical protein
MAVPAPTAAVAGWAAVGRANRDGVAVNEIGGTTLNRRRSAAVGDFQALARLGGASVHRAGPRRAQRASRASARVDRRASEIETGFFFVGDVPADNPTAHVVRERDARGRMLHKVLVGAYLDRASATASALELARKTGLETFVRPL